MKLTNEMILDFLHQETNSKDLRKLRILNKVPDVMNYFLKPHDPSLSADERFISCLLNWRDDLLASGGLKTDIILYALKNIIDFYKLLTQLCLLPCNKELMSEVIEFDVSDYAKLCKICGIYDTSKALKRMNNFKDITVALSKNKFSVRKYIAETEKQYYHFQFIANKFSTFESNLEDIPIVMLLFDVRH